jgi:hypothetical protein
MAKKRDDQRLFDYDRRIELKLRLAAKRAAETPTTGVFAGVFGPLPPREILDRLIERVRRL